MGCWRGPQHAVDYLRLRRRVLPTADGEDHQFGSHSRAELCGKICRVGSSWATTMMRKYKNTRAGIGALSKQVLETYGVYVSR